jgi:putative ABC transport system ATP-binding protein
VMLPMEFMEYDDIRAANVTRGILQMVGLGEKMNNRPSQLSGGEQQRVSIARSLAGDPEIILADEPTGALDSTTGREVITMLRKLWKEQGKTVIMVTHDINLAKFAHTTIELKDGQITKISENHEVDKR